MARARRGSRAALLAALAYAGLALFLLGGVFSGRVLFLRDLSSQFYPDYSFVARALAQRVWPLWNPTLHAGMPWLTAYPLDLLLLWLGGAPLALGPGVALHLALAMAGGYRLARELGQPPLSAFLAGAVYGLSGSVLSLINLLPLFEGAAWLPWVVAAALRSLRRGGAATGVFAVLLALQISTLAAETVVLTALAALMLSGWRELRRGWRRAAVGVLLALLLAAPVLAGVVELTRGTARGAGFTRADSLAHSASPLLLLEAALPRFFGNVHSFDNSTFWAPALFPDGFPYLLSLYLGAPALLLAACSREKRLLVLAGTGALLALGDHGPLAFALAPWSLLFRAPIKFFLLATLGLALAAGTGLDRVCRERPGSWRFVPGLLLLLLAGLAAVTPGVLARGLQALAPGVAPEPALLVATVFWPGAFFVSGALGVAAALAAGPRFTAAAIAAVTADMLIVNAAINPLAPARFFELREEVRPLVERIAAAAPARVYAYGVGYASPVPWDRSVAERDSDVWLYYMDRQALLPRTHVLDGLEGAYEVDRTGWAPFGSSLGVGLTSPRALAAVAGRLERANVRFVLSFDPLPAALATERGRARLAEIHVPLRLYELERAWPRAFWLPALDAEPGPASPGSSVAYERVDPHTLRLHARTPPGYVAVLDGYHRGFRLRGPEGEVEMLRFGDRYWAFATPGGDRAYEARFEPSWVGPAAAVALIGALGVALTALSRPREQGRKT